MPKKLQALAFLSYVRFDDEYEDGRLSDLRKRLSGEVRLQTGEEFPIFQDRNDIRWGEAWKTRIEDAVDSATFLIPIMTPGFFKSPACRAEVERFLERERKLDRTDLILPIYYVSAPVLDEKAKRARDKLAKELTTRQYADLRELRFEPFTSPEVRRAIAQLASQVCDVLTSKAARRTPAEPSRPRRRRTAEQKQVADPTVTAQPADTLPAASPSSPSPKTEPPTRVVDPLLRGDHASISEAIDAASPGDRIVVRPGLYEEALVIEKPLEIVGDGDLGDIVIRAKGSNVVLFRTTMGRLANLTLRQAGDGNWYALNIAQGRLEIDGCDISSDSRACVAIHDGADPRLRRNIIHGGKSGGVFVYDNGQGTLEDNDIHSNALAGVEITTGGNPTLRRNQIHDGKTGGVFVHENAQGTLEDNDIHSNALAGVEITTGGNPTLRRNQIHDGKTSGVFVHGNGQGTLEDNDIHSNALAGVSNTTGGNPRISGNRISRNGTYGVRASEAALGVTPKQVGSVDRGLVAEG